MTIGAVGHGATSAAVETDAAGWPRRNSLHCVKGFRLNAITRWRWVTLVPGTTMHSDGLACYVAVAAAGCEHAPTVMRGPGLAFGRPSLDPCGPLAQSRLVNEDGDPALFGRVVFGAGQRLRFQRLMAGSFRSRAQELRRYDEKSSPVRMRQTWL